MAGTIHWPSGRPPASWGPRPPRPRRVRRSAVVPAVNVEIRIVDVESGTVLAIERGHNLVTNAGGNLLRDFLNNDASAGIVDFALGTSDTAVAATDIALGAEALREPFTLTTTSPLLLTVQYFLSSAALNGTTIREAGLFTDDDTLFARYVLTASIPKTSGIAVTFLWEIQITVMEMTFAERGSVVELGGDANTFSLGNTYPTGATLDKIVNSSATWLIDSADLLGGTFALEGHVKTTSTVTCTPTIGLFNLTDAPDTALTGSEVSGSSGNTTGERIRSGAITFPTSGADKQLAVKVKTNNASGEAIVWGLRIVRLT